LRLGQLLLSGSEPRPDQALASWKTALTDVRQPADYQNPHFDLAHLRSLLTQGLELLLQAEDFDRARQLAELYRSVAPPGAADMKLAQVLEADARQQQASELAKADDVARRFQLAGAAHERAAASAPAEKRGESLWRGVQCYLVARSAGPADRLLTKLDALAPKDDRIAEGWYRLGELHREQKHAEPARQAYLRSMEFAQSAYAARARYYLALDEVEKKDWKRAADILQQNLNLGPAVDREAHEKSMYKLGAVLFEARDYGRAEYFLKQALGRYPNNGYALVTRDYLAECYRHLARLAEQKEQDQARSLRPDLPAENRTQLEETMRHHRQTRRKYLGDSTAVYQALADELKDRARQRPLKHIESALLRRALLGQADNQTDLTEYRSALKLYQELLHAHRGHIETLIACERIYALAALTSETEQKRIMTDAAREAITLALEDLRRMAPDSSSFRGPDVWTRERWQRELAAMQAALNTPPASSRPMSVIP
jgi:hypothetical protein